MTDQIEMRDPSCLSPKIPASRRHAAGADPAKRDQILDGANQVFFEKGFDRTNIDDVCRAAGVSKGTIYVYFNDKVDLFEALVARQRDRLFEGIEAVLTLDLPLPQKLTDYGSKLCGILCSDPVIRAQRIIIGAAEDMPDMASRFYDAGALRSQTLMRQLIAREIEAGTLRVPDPDLAAYQFVELSTAGLWRKRLFAKVRTPPTPDQIAAVVDGAVTMFLSTYGNGIRD